MVEFVDLPSAVPWAKIGYDNDTDSVILEVSSPPDTNLRLHVEPDAARALARGLTQAAARLSMGVRV